MSRNFFCLGKQNMTDASLPRLRSLVRHFLSLSRVTVTNNFFLSFSELNTHIPCKNAKHCVLSFLVSDQDILFSILLRPLLPHLQRPPRDPGPPLQHPQHPTVHLFIHHWPPLLLQELSQLPNTHVLLLLPPPRVCCIGLQLLLCVPKRLPPPQSCAQSLHDLRHLTSPVGYQFRPV